MNDLERARARYAFAKARRNEFLRHNTDFNHQFWIQGIDTHAAAKRWVELCDEMHAAERTLEQLEP